MRLFDLVFAASSSTAASAASAAAASVTAATAAAAQEPGNQTFLFDGVNFFCSTQDMKNIFCVGCGGRGGCEKIGNILFFEAKILIRFANLFSPGNRISFRIKPKLNYFHKSILHCYGHCGPKMFFSWLKMTPTQLKQSGTNFEMT